MPDHWRGCDSEVTSVKSISGSRRTVSLGTCIALAIAGAAQGATYYVSTAGNDLNSGAQSAPFRHVSKGASAAHAGDTVIVMDGTYDNEGKIADSSGGGSVVNVTNVGTAASPITIMAQNRGGAILNAASTTKSTLGCYGAWAYFDLSYTAYVTIQGFVIENACINAFHANATAHDITIRWNEIKNIGNWNNPAGTLSPTGIYLNSQEYNFKFDGNTWHDIGGGTNVNQQHAIYTAASSVTIVNNIFYNQVHGWDIQTSGGKNIYIANNTFAFANPNRSGHIILWDDYVAGSLGNVIIQNNVFYQPLSYAVVSDLSGPISCTMQYNITTAGSMWDNGSSCSMSNNLTSTDPKLVNPSGLDFHLQSGSPAIDSGLAVSYTAIDMENTARPYNSIFDRGSYEFHGGGSGGSGTTPGLSLSANPSTVSVTQNSTATSTITVTVTGALTPAFSVSGLPSGVTASFAPSSCSASCTTTLTLSASSSASGSANVSVSATSGTVSSSTTLAVSVINPAGDYTTGLVADWKLLGNAVDSTGGLNGTIHGGVSFISALTLFSGLSANLTLLLDGSTGYVSAPESAALEMTKQLSVAFWVYANPASNRTIQGLVAKLRDWDIRLNGAYPQFTINNQYATANYTLPLGTWTHIVFTLSSGSPAVYVNGQQVGISASTLNRGTKLPAAANGVNLGTDSTGANFFAGQMSDVRIYNRPLADTDVRALFNAGATAILH